MGPRYRVLDGNSIPQGKGQFVGLSGPLKSIGNLCCSIAVAFTLTGIIQSPIMSCSRRIIQYARQVQIVFWKFLGAGDAAYLPQWGWWDCTAGAKSDIYDCLWCMFSLEANFHWTSCVKVTLISNLNTNEVDVSIECCIEWTEHVGVIWRLQSVWLGRSLEPDTNCGEYHTMTVNVVFYQSNIVDYQLVQLCNAKVSARFWVYITRFL